MTRIKSPNKDVVGTGIKLGDVVTFRAKVTDLDRENGVKGLIEVEVPGANDSTPVRVRVNAGACALVKPDGTSVLDAPTAE